MDKMTDAEVQIYKKENKLNLLTQVKCYRQIMYFHSRQEAIDFFTEGMWCCDPYSSEYSRYEKIVTELEQGIKIPSDE